MPLTAEDFSGRMRFAAVDSLTVGAVKVRLNGIDAPEIDQTCNDVHGAPWPCGKWAANEAKARFEGRRALCTALDRDRYDCVVARCFDGKRDISDSLVRDGIATDHRNYSLDSVDAEKAASNSALGIWAGTPAAPSDHRAASRTVPQPTGVGCDIKENIPKSGRIYHLPRQEFYNEARISPARGERWFCSESEARAAWWRRARGNRRFDADQCGPPDPSLGSLQTQ